MDSSSKPCPVASASGALRIDRLEDTQGSKAQFIGFIQDGPDSSPSSWRFVNRSSLPCEASTLDEGPPYIRRQKVAPRNVARSCDRSSLLRAKVTLLPPHLASQSPVRSYSQRFRYDRGKPPQFLADSHLRGRIRTLMSEIIKSTPPLGAGQLNVAANIAAESQGFPTQSDDE